jgi:predicted kinase
VERVPSGVRGVKQLRCPLIDKDDARDLFENQTPGTGGLAYDIMFNIARRQLLQELSVICDSPLTDQMGYERAQAIAAETNACLVLIECVCSDESVLRQRITARQTLGLPSHHQTDWNRFEEYRHFYFSQATYSITHPHLVVDTVKQLDECLMEITRWLANRMDVQDGWTSTPNFRSM